MTHPDPSQAAAPLERLQAKTALLGESLTIRRALPHPRRRMIGAWCFLDHAGPVAPGAGELRVGPHPHIGLQTFTWMIEGQLLHRDSLGSEQLIRPGQVNLMTAGRGISHSEESVADAGSGLHTAQLWIALPDAHRHVAPAFDHYPQLPVWHDGGFELTLLAGRSGAHIAPARVYSPLLGLDLRATGAAQLRLDVAQDFEHGVMVLDGAARIADEVLAPGELLYLPPGRAHLDVACADACRLLLIGGAPFNEPVLLWWNFVARTQEEVEQATQDWNHGTRFGVVQGYVGARLVAPDLRGARLRGG